jgi:hypothetical protein
VEIYKNLWKKMDFSIKFHRKFHRFPWNYCVKDIEKFIERWNFVEKNLKFYNYFLENSTKIYGIP